MLSDHNNRKLSLLPFFAPDPKHHPTAYSSVPVFERFVRRLLVIRKKSGLVAGAHFRQTFLTVWKVRVPKAPAERGQPPHISVPARWVSSLTSSIWRRRLSASSVTWPQRDGDLFTRRGLNWSKKSATRGGWGRRRRGRVPLFVSARNATFHFLILFSSLSHSCSSSSRTTPCVSEAQQHGHLHERRQEPCKYPSADAYVEFSLSKTLRASPSTLKSKLRI